MKRPNKNEERERGWGERRRDDAEGYKDRGRGGSTKTKREKKGRRKRRDGLSLSDGPPLRLVGRVVVLELERGVVADGGDRDGGESPSRHVGDVVDGDAAERETPSERRQRREVEKRERTCSKRSRHACRACWGSRRSQSANACCEPPCRGASTCGCGH